MESKAECEICEIVLPTKNEYYVHANESHPNNVAKYWYECGHCKVRVLFNLVWERLESGKLLVFNTNSFVCRVRLSHVPHSSH
jgi:hypothetical protein